jgi:hypothetical protein
MKKKTALHEPVKPQPSVEDLRREYIDIANDPAATIRERLQALIAYEKLSGFNKPPKPEDAAAFDPLDDILDVPRA